MNLYDVLQNWLQLQLVADARPNDEAAQTSLEHVNHILAEDHQVEVISIDKMSDTYEVTYSINETQKKQAFSIQSAEALLQFINENPERYDFK